MADVQQTGLYATPFLFAGHSYSCPMLDCDASTVDLARLNVHSKEPTPQHRSLLPPHPSLSQAALMPWSRPISAP